MAGQLTLAAASAILRCHTEVVKELITVLGIPVFKASHPYKIDATEFYRKTRNLIPGWKMMELLVGMNRPEERRQKPRMKSNSLDCAATRLISAKFLLSYRNFCTILLL